jgi:hypothetical protein
VRLAIGRGASLTLRGDRLGRASGRLAVPASAGRATLTVRADGTTSRLDFTVTALGVPSPGPAPGPAPEGPAPPGPPPGNPPAPAPAPRLVAVGDIACAPGVPQTPASCHHAEVAALVQSLAPDAIAALGDLQYETGALIEFQQVFDPTWGTPFGSRLRPVPGNHEYLTPNGAGYFSYFGSAAADPAQGWYAYDLGSWRVIALNTNDNCSTVACNAGSAQEQFLRDQLVANAGRCTAVYWHHPRFSSGALVGNDTAVNALWTDAYSLGADVVLNGHAHNYERLAKMNELGTPAAGGLRQFVSGGGGEDLEPFSGPPYNTHSEFRLKAFGALELTLRDGGYDWRFLTEDGVVQDSGTDACRQ